jgi:plasmid maintenance system killer protein
MNIFLTDLVVEALKDAQLPVRRAFDKQLRFLAANLQHPSLQAKKYDESQDRWQARVNKNWRFYFKIVGDTYVIADLMPHPKK